MRTRSLRFRSGPRSGSASGSSSSRDLHEVKIRHARRTALYTVCEEARCPNRGECFARGTATFLLLGDVCTRACGFCDIANGQTAAGRSARARRVRRRPQRMKLGFVVLTSVDRDDLPDGGAAHFAATIAALRTARARAGRRGPDSRLSRAARVARAPSSRRSPTSSTTTSRRCPGSTATCAAARTSSARSGSSPRPQRPGSGADDEVRLHARPRRARRTRSADAARAAARRGRRHRDDRAVPAPLAGEPAGRRVRPSRGLRALPRGRARRLGFRHVFAGPFVRSSYRAEEALPPPEPPPGTRPDRSDRVAVMARRWRTLAAGVVSGILFALAFPAVRVGRSCCRSRSCPGSSRSRARRAGRGPSSPASSSRFAYWCLSIPWISYVVTVYGGQSGVMGIVCLGLILARDPAPQWSRCRGLGHGRRRARRVGAARLAAFPVLWMAAEHARTVFVRRASRGT